MALSLEDGCLEMCVSKRLMQVLIYRTLFSTFVLNNVAWKGYLLNVRYGNFGRSMPKRNNTSKHGMILQ
ncbi:hypothetical protein C7460_12716 [Marinoscillum furvescens DSM 4134]|uniref:Uncharacterized protein n=1 Tax=Marinoscillum furvescens DSM 4134 TaxID=1122208 RepID=A0A3D9KYQ9_MARFU|nr:hypothetical protein C7460_12716 [Marinoscillum furvescens DSM 4134]